MSAIIQRSLEMAVLFIPFIKNVRSRIGKKHTFPLFPLNGSQHFMNIFVSPEQQLQFQG